MTLDLTAFDALSFDCYGTLIDWESGIAAAFRRWAEGRALNPSDEKILALHSKYESPRQEAQPTQLYSALLADVLRDMAGDLGESVTDREARSYGNSVSDWPAFPDSAEALTYLKTRYKLVILSNVDRASFAGSNKRLGVTFDLIVTAEDVGAYKPALAHFERGFRELAAIGVDKGRILHVAESLHHDHYPAKRLNLASVWINRRAAKGAAGFGATRPPAGDYAYAAEYPSLAAFAADVKAAFGDA